MESVNLTKEVFGANTYRNVIDTTFTQLVTPAAPFSQSFTVEEFFAMYESIFYEIPIDGAINSHTYLVRRSSDYVGGAVLSDNEQALIDEINNLRQQLLEANRSIVDISKLT
jgi:hypothetical protein